MVAFMVFGESLQFFGRLYSVPQFIENLPQQHERPDLVELKDILSLGREQGFLHVGQAQEFFFNHCVIVLRVIPKVRLSPRSEERS